MTRRTRGRLLRTLPLFIFSLTLGASAQEPARADAEELLILGASIQVLQESFATPVSRSELLLAAVRGMVKEIDPSGGEFLGREDLRELRQGYSGGSVGLEITERDGNVVIVAPISGSPAERAGLRPQDVVRAVDGTQLSGRDLRKVVRLLRGDVNSSVRVTVWRPSEAALMDVTLTRSRVSRPSVTLLRPSAGVAVLKISRIAENTLPELANRLADIETQDPKGIVLDLRRNTGGTVRESIGVAALFLSPNDVVAYSQGRTPESNVVFRAAPQYYAPNGVSSDPFRNVSPVLRKLPLVVLVDEGTASGAEIIAGALRDHRRARIVGRKTFGRASIQTVAPIQDVAIKYTSAYWRTPAGDSLDRKGIVPDRLVREVDGQAGLDEAIDELAKMF